MPEPSRILSPLLMIPLLAVLAPLASAGQDRKNQDLREIQWVDVPLDDAVVEARERNVPLVIFCVLKDEEASERFRDQLEQNRTLATAMQKALPIYVSQGDPPGDVELTHHTTNWGRVYQRYVAEVIEDGEWVLPEVIYVGPAGDVSLRLGHRQPPADSTLVDGLMDVIEKIGPGLTREELATCRTLVEQGRKAHLAKNWSEAWRAWHGILAVTEFGPFAEEAARLEPEALKGVRAELAAASEGIDESNLAERYATLRGLERLLRGSPLEKEAGSAVKAVEKDKRFKKLVAEMRVDEDAEDLRIAVAALIAAGDEKKAKRELKKLLGKKYGSTPAADRARKDWEELLKR